MHAAGRSSKFGGELITWRSICLCAITHNTIEFCLTEDASFLRRAAEQLIQPDASIVWLSLLSCSLRLECSMLGAG
jgi:hypothetical protein